MCERCTQARPRGNSFRRYFAPALQERKAKLYPWQETGQKLAESESTPWDSPVRTCTDSTDTPTQLSVNVSACEGKSLSRNDASKMFGFLQCPWSPLAYSRCGHTYPLHVSFEQSKYSSDAWFHHEQWLNNQHPSLLGQGRHEGLNPKAVRGLLLNFPFTQPPQKFPLTAAGSSPCLSRVSWLSYFCSLENWALRHL